MAINDVAGERVYHVMRLYSSWISGSYCPPSHNSCLPAIGLVIWRRRWLQR